MPSRFGPKFIAKLPLHRLFTLLERRPRFRTKSKTGRQQNGLHGKTPKLQRSAAAETPGPNEAPLPHNLPQPLASGEKKGSARGILKPDRISHVDEALVPLYSTHDYHVTWGETHGQEIELIGHTQLPVRKDHTGIQSYRKRRLLLQYLLKKDAEHYKDKLSPEPCANSMPLGRAETIDSLYRASHKLLESSHLSFEDRVYIHTFFSEVKPSQEERAYHADLLIDMISKAMNILFGPRYKHNYIVNDAMKIPNLKEKLVKAQKTLQAANGGQRHDVCCNRLARGGEGRRIYMDNSEYKENPDSVIPEPAENEDAPVCILAQDTAEASVSVDKPDAE